MWKVNAGHWKQIMRAEVQFLSMFYVKSVQDCGMFLYIIVYFAIFTVMQLYLILQEHVTPVGLCKLLIAS